MPSNQKKFLIKHVGNMGDLVFFIPPVLETLKRHYPGCHITLVTAWGFKEKKTRWLASRSLGEGWGKRNQDGFCIALMMTNPHIDQLVHWHDKKLSLEANICQEEGQRFPTWNRHYYEAQKESGHYDSVWELDFGLTIDDNPIQKIYQTVGLPDEQYSNYQLHLTQYDRQVAQFVMRAAPRPRIVFLEGLEGTTTRGWDPEKIPGLVAAIKQKYDVMPVWFGARHVGQYHGRPLTLRENIATLAECDVAVGVLSGPLHFAAAVGLPTLTLYSDQPLHRAAPGYFLNSYIKNGLKKHRTLIGPACLPFHALKADLPPDVLTKTELLQQDYQGWLTPGRQATKTGLATIGVEEVMTVVQDMLE